MAVSAAKQCYMRLIILRLAESISELCMDAKYILVVCSLLWPKHSLIILSGTLWSRAIVAQV